MTRSLDGETEGDVEEHNHHGDVAEHHHVFGLDGVSSRNGKNRTIRASPAGQRRKCDLLSLLLWPICKG